MSETNDTNNNKEGEPNQTAEVKEEVKNEEIKEQSASDDTKNISNENNKEDNDLPKDSDKPNEGNQNTSETAKVEQTSAKVEDTQKTVEPEIKIIEKPCEKCPELQKQLAESKSNSAILIQTTKQIFLKYLDDPIFMDNIQTAFENSNDNSKFLEQILNLTELLEQKLALNNTLKVFKDIPEILKDIESFNLKLNLKQKLDEFQKISNIQTLKSIKPTDLLEDLLKELINYTTNLLKSLMSQAEKIEEVKMTNESKDNQIINLTNEINDLKSKLTNKSTEADNLKKNILNLNNQIELLSNENKKILNERQKTMNEKDDINKNISMLNEKISVLNQQLNLFKIENVELSDKTSQLTKENEEYKKKIEILNKNINVYKEKFTELEKNAQSIKDLQSQIALKDSEIEKIKTKYVELEKYFEDSKIEKAKMNEDYNQILTEIKGKNEEINKENFDLKNELNDLKKKSSATEGVNEKYQELEKNYLNKELEFKSLQENFDKLKKANEEILLRVNKENLSKQSLVDKAMLKSLVLKYFDMTISHSIKISLLETIANFLEFNNNERKYVGLQPKKEGTQSNQNGEENENADGLAKAGNDLYNFITKS